MNATAGRPEPAQDRGPRRVRIVPGGPMLIEGPVEIVLDDGTTVTSDRFLVALCTCRRSRAYPFCDTSHRRRPRPPHGSPRPTDDHDEGCRDGLHHGRRL